MNTPTPRTDAFAIIASPSRNQYLDFAEQLERELTAVTEQRDKLAELSGFGEFDKPTEP